MQDTQTEETSVREAARYSLFRERPGVGVALLLLSLAIPLLVSLLLILVADEFFLASLANKIAFAFILGLSIGASVWITNLIRNRLILRAVREQTRSR